MRLNTFVSNPDKKGVNEDRKHQNDHSERNEIKV